MNVLESEVDGEVGSVTEGARRDDELLEVDSVVGGGVRRWCAVEATMRSFLKLRCRGWASIFS